MPNNDIELFRLYEYQIVRGGSLPDMTLYFIINNDIGAEKCSEEILLVEDYIQRYINYLRAHTDNYKSVYKIDLAINLSDADKFIDLVDNITKQPPILPDIKQVLDYLEGGDANTNANI